MDGRKGAGGWDLITTLALLCGWGPPDTFNGLGTINKNTQPRLFTFILKKEIWP